MKAIIVPGLTDLNKGDQALVWESHRLVKDTNLFNEIYIIESGSNKEEKYLLSGQTKAKGLPMIENILPHPRRNKRPSNQHVVESKFEILRQISNAVIDFIQTSFLLLICKNATLLRIFFSSKVVKTVTHFAESDAVFVKGGGFIHAYGEKTAPYLMWYFLFYIRLGLKLNKKVIILPNSFGPFEGLTVKKQVRKVLSKVDLIYARENTSSYELGHLLGRKIQVESDLGFFLQKGNDEIAIEILDKYDLSIEDKIIGITVRPWRFPGSNNPSDLYVKYIGSVVQLIMYLVEKGYKIALCNQSLGLNSHEDDRNAIRDLLAAVTHPNVVWIDENLTCDVLKSLYSHFYFFVGTRFHSIIFSLTSLVPSIAIGYGGNKAKGIMGDFDLDNYLIPINEINSSILIESFDNAILNYDKTKYNLSKSINKISESRNSMINDIRLLF